MRRAILIVLALFAGVVVSARSATAQVTTATLYGVVTDEAGAAVPGATATMRHEATGTVSTKVTDASGEFVFGFMPIGLYTLKIELTGFKTYERRGLELGSGQNVRQTYVLPLGQLEETVTV